MKETSPHSYNTELERRILHGLALEWQSALWVLPPREARQMKPPVFSLKDGEKTLANWNPVKREISFSRTFVLNYPWDDIREVLVHEMAHQYASEILNVTHETPHGPGFVKACRSLRANPKASGTYTPLSDRIEHDDESGRDKLMIRIKKLLSLGQSTNRHEAEAAVAKAHHLIRKYNIDMLQKESERNFISVFVGKPALRRFREDYLLARLLVDHYFIFGIWVNAYVLDKKKMGRVFEITGTPANVKIATYVYDFISRHMHMEWNTFNKGKDLNRSRKTDFLTGLIQGFSSTLKKEDMTETQGIKKQRGDKTPMIVDDQALKDYTAFKYPRIVQVSRRGSACDAEVINEGKKAGKKLILFKGVEKHHHGGVLPLPERSSS